MSCPDRAQVFPIATVRSQVEPITKREAARRAEVSERTVNRWIAEGRLIAYTRPGHKRIYVDADDLRTLLEFRPKPRR